VHVLQVLEALDGSGIAGELGLTLGVPVGEVRLGRGHVVVVAEHEQLRCPGVLVGLDDRGDAGRLDLRVVRHELGPGLGDLQTELVEDLLVVEHGPGHEAAPRRAVHLAVGRHRRLEVVLELPHPGLVVQRNQVLLRRDRLE
jgi:hypothetical protein